MDLKFKQSNIGCYQIVMYDGKKYLLDTSTIAPKPYLLGFLPRKVTATMVEINSEYKEFELKERNISTVVVAAVVQPFVKLGYDFLKRVFVDKGVSDLLPLKLALFVVVIILSFFIVLYSLVRASKKAKSRLNDSEEILTIVFRTNNHRFFENYFWIVLIGSLFGLYLRMNNGSEGAILVITGGVTMLAFISGWTMISIPALYKKGSLTFEEIK